jgi:zinc transporter ZupT
MFICKFADNPKLQHLINYIICIIGKSVIPLILTLAVATFVWGVVQYVINDQEEAKKEKGRMFMIWGVIGITVMVSVWGLVGILGSTFNIDTKFVPQLKQ